MTEADRPGTRLSAPMAQRDASERVGHSVNIRRMLSYVEGPSSFKLANKSARSPSPYDVACLRPAVPHLSTYPAILRASRPRCTPSLLASTARTPPRTR